MKKILLAFCAAGLAMTAMGATPKVVAHRGYHRAEGSAQNSIRSLVKADSIGAWGSEFDVWSTADGKLYVNHNADINGVVIETSDWKAVDTCHLKNGERIPRLEDFLDKAMTLKTNLVLEVKPHHDKDLEARAIRKIIGMINERGLAPRTYYITFSKPGFELLAAESGRPTYFLTGTEPEYIEKTGGAGADYHISHFRKNPTWIPELHKMGKEVNIWTVDKEEDIIWCIDNDADYITTNEPELTQKLIKAHKKK